MDTDGVGGVPVDGAGSPPTGGHWCGDGCEQLLPHTTSVDLNRLPEDMEATRSVVESVLTEGAIVTGFEV
ncbi:fimbrial usher protein PixC [Escherichia coli]|nr:fimbrial usher protein PixC [Escherichia coli]